MKRSTLIGGASGVIVAIVLFALGFGMLTASRGQSGYIFLQILLGPVFLIPSWFGLELDRHNDLLLIIPATLVFWGGAGATVSMAINHFRPRSRQPGKCNECGYDLRGNKTGKCPECGASAAETTSEST